MSSTKFHKGKEIDIEGQMSWYTRRKARKEKMDISEDELNDKIARAKHVKPCGSTGGWL